MINYAIHRIADAFTSDFYVDYMRFQMKPYSDPYPHNLYLFNTKETY
jgi:hypothetical protein